MAEQRTVGVVLVADGRNCFLRLVANFELDATARRLIEAAAGQVYIQWGGGDLCSCIILPHSPSLSIEHLHRLAGRIANRLQVTWTHIAPGDFTK